MELIIVYLVHFIRNLVQFDAIFPKDDKVKELIYYSSKMNFEDHKINKNILTLPASLSALIDQEV